MKSAPIGVFDSGVGGLTVMREIARFLPQENLVYLGDTARLPYGNKSPSTILQFAQENAAFLLKNHCKLIVIACNTACCHAFASLSAQIHVPVIGVIQPGCDALMRSFPITKRVAILGTTSTIESGIYQNWIRDRFPQAEVFAVACPLFVPLVEEGYYNHESAFLIAKTYLDPLRGKIDAALLACTHYPIMRSVIQEVLGPGVALIESAIPCALEVHQYLKKNDLLNTEPKKPLYQFFTTDAPEKFRLLGKAFFGEEIEFVVRKNSC